MTQTVFRTTSLAAALAAFSLGLAPGAQAHSPEAAYLSERAVETHPSQGPVREVKGAKAVLLTTGKGAFASLATRELTPGNAYTLWWVVINDPAACETLPCKPPDVLERSKITRADVSYADGVIARDDGTARFTSHLPAGPLAHGWFGNGFDNPLGAEIHLVVNDHGPLLPQMAASMLGSYRGGCTDESLPAAFPATAKADGTPGPNTCRLVQDVIVIQQATKVGAKPSN